MRLQLYCLPLVALCALSLAGCVSESTDGSTRVYSYQLWVPMSVLLGGMVAGPAGWFLRLSSARFGWALMIGGVIAGLGFAPSLFLDKATVSEQQFTQRTGIWGMTAVHTVNVDQLSHVRLTKEERRGRRGRKNTSYFMICHLKDGSQEKVPLGNSVSQTAAGDFLQVVESRNISISDET